MRLAGRAVAAMALVLAFFGAQPALAQQDGSATKDATSRSRAESEPVVKKRLIFLLSAYHGQPTRAQLDEIAEAEAVAAHLRDIVSDRSVRPSMRLRALDRLGHFGDRDSVAFLRRVVEAPGELEVRRLKETELLRQHAMLSLARVRKEESVATLLPFVDADDLQTRLSAISALGRFGGSAGRAELAKLRGRAEHPAVERSLKKFVGPASNE